MVRVSIYNEKGGVGKTTISYLLAGYLAYARGRSVCVVDFDAPGFHFSEIRREEEAILRNPKSQLSIWLRNHPSANRPYDIYEAPYTTSGVFSPSEVIAFLESLSDYDVVILDFPGRFTEDEPVAVLAANGMLDYVAIPTDTDSQSRKSALVVADAMMRQGVPCDVFWNRVTTHEAHGNGNRFIRGSEPFLKMGIPVMEKSVREVRKLSRDSSELQFVRSTLCFPTRYINYWSPSLIPFLDALVSRIDNLKNR